MKAYSSSPLLLGAFLVLLAFSGARAQELISDVTTSAQDESKALEIKANKFWSGVLQVAESARVEEHAAAFDRVQDVIDSLPKENSHVAELLQDALTRVKRADSTVFRQRLVAEKISLDSLAKGGGVDADEASGFEVFGSTLRRFVTGEGRHKGAGAYPERLQKQVLDRQDKILPLLQGTAQEAGNVLEDCRLGTKLSFDVRKYDIYNRGVPKTPKVADDAADELIKVSGEVRKSFTSLIIGTVKSIAADTETKTEKPAVTVVQSALSKNILQNSLQNRNTEENLINL